MGKFASYFALAAMSQANSAVWPVPYACAQPYNSGKVAAMEGELIRPHCDSSSWPPDHGFDLTGVRRLCHSYEP